MFSHTTEYALRAVVSLGYQPGVPMKTSQIAEMTKVPSNYLSKVLQVLVKAKVLASRRGIKGGFTLIKQPNTLTLLEVISATEPLRRITACPLGLPGHRTDLCALHKRLDSTIALIEHEYQTTTVADLLDGSASSRPLCGSGQSDLTSLNSRPAWGGIV